MDKKDFIMKTTSPNHLLSGGKTITLEVLWLDVYRKNSVISPNEITLENWSYLKETVNTMSNGLKREKKI
jgi:hypothetical protein